MMALTLLTGAIYPAIVTGVGALIFPNLSRGGFVRRGEHLVGARLIGQKFVSEKYFWGRPSSVDYNPLPSGGSNLGPTSAALKKAVEDRAVNIRRSHGLSEASSLPKDLLFASGSGLDPEISPLAARFQVDRVVQVRHFNESQKQKLLQLIESETMAPDWFYLGEPRINVLLLNLKLDEIDEIVARQ
jgi:K+-transporting ATPase ATPase C chain